MCFRAKKRDKKGKPFGSLLQKLYCFLAGRILNKKQMTTEFFPFCWSHWLFTIMNTQKKAPSNFAFQAC